MTTREAVYSVVSFAKFSTTPEPEKLVCPERFILGKQEQSFPKEGGGVWLEMPPVPPSPSWFKPGSGKEGQRSPYQTASGTTKVYLRCDPGPLLQSPTVGD